MLKVWGRTNSINVQKVMWALAELGVQHARIDAGMAFGVVNTPEYRAMNPNGRVPTIQDGALVLYESNAIVRYLYAKYGPARTVEAVATADKWMDWCATTVGAPVTTLFWGWIRTPAEKRDPAALEAALKQAGDIFAIADAALAQTPYIAGGEFSMGDIPLGCFVHRWLNLPVARPAAPHLAQYYERLLARPAYREHVALPLS
jgi:glutathione S-transferase